MSFVADELDKDKDNDEFFSDAKTGIQPITGSGQTIYWQGCTIKVFKTGMEHLPPLQRLGVCNGQVRLQKGVSILLEGGKVKEV
ncbi:hypothetical protein LX32DRAFT_645467 [Colletotrichum zoysiae]|uniref:Uncharacterized protein n=1 Tax=Colletotrichum zoysiae TaxID=1216348 RepID=A0AAD9H676_9PEZI|nr:hypothetical protein LX32DRAFT_645467 [Colletotrichum zoysiae]